MPFLKKLIKYLKKVSTKLIGSIMTEQSRLICNHAHFFSHSFRVSRILELGSVNYYTGAKVVDIIII